jgi:uncharacterized cupin superfamily protein
MEKYKYNLDIQMFASIESAIQELSDKEMLNYARNIQLPDFLGDTLFPDVKTSSLTAVFVANKNLLPVSASVHSFDTKTQVASRDGFESFEFEKILIKRQVRINEKLMLILNQPRSKVEYNETLKQIFDDARNMMLAVKTRAERMKMDVLANGEIVVDENNVKYTFDYSVPDEHKETITTETDKWSDTENSDPLGDIQEWSDKIVDDTGVRPTRALTSLKILRLLQKNKNIQISVNGENYQGKAITLDELNNFMEMNDLPVIATYDAKYRKEDETGKQTKERFFPEDKFVMFPDDNLGNGMYGATPTEIRRVKGTMEDVSFGNIHVTVRDEDDPVRTVTKAESVFIPSFPAYNEVFQAKVI